ncbi:uncharacterized protein LOC128474951 [Spea bombifrons]|uniref:uncharacterized protein LOC128474951 n=1 Tax=Spea bombifrons TaxID=233779 RepID=UPI002349A010|nr:uncharacterized protein LOC128474951 [Spea bombifrons]
MGKVWYRQYFWLLLFAGIILFTGIFSLITVCICLKKKSKRISLQNQQSFKQKKREDQHEHPVTFIQNTSHESFLPKILPEQETEPITLPRNMYAMSMGGWPGDRGHSKVLKKAEGTWTGPLAGVGTPHYVSLQQKANCLHNVQERDNATEKTEDTKSESHYYVESMTDHEYIVFDDCETNTEHLQYDYVIPDSSSDDDDYDDVVIPHEYMKRE